MKAKKPTIGTAALFAAILVAMVLWLLWYAPPLRSSSDYAVTYEFAGQRHSDAQLFRPVGMSERYYISVPSPSDPRYGWFVVDFSRGLALTPLFGVVCPYGSPCVHRDQALGLPLTDSKIEDHWQVSITREAVHFSNGTMSVSMVKNQ